MVTKRDSVEPLARFRERFEDAEIDPLRATVKAVAEVRMSVDASGRCAAPSRSPTGQPVNQRNRYRERRWGTRLGTIDLAPLKVWAEIPPSDGGEDDAHRILRR